MASKKTSPVIAGESGPELIDLPKPHYVAPVPGLPVRVIKDGGTWDHPGIIQSVGVDDEVLMGTWMTIIVDHDQPERTQLQAIRLDTEQECRDRSARDRRRYFVWCVE